jgi:hypothetical protein
MGCVEFVIEPKPAEDERAAVVAALEQLGTFAPRPAARWGRPELELDDVEDTWHAATAGWAPGAGSSGGGAARE